VRRDGVQPLDHLKPGRVGGHDEGRQALRARRLAGAGEDSVDIGDAAIGDPRLFPVEHEIRRRRAWRSWWNWPRRSPDCGSVSAKAEIALPARVSGSHSARCASVPKSVIAPVPSPCMAKAKSASPSWRARISRASGTACARQAPCLAAVSCKSPASPSRVTSARQAASVSA
jgi:hypothetical protein